MQTLIRTVSAALLLVVCGCVRSLHPLYTEQDLVYEPALLGEWTGKDGKQTYTVTKSGERGYSVTHVDEEGKRGEYDVHLVKVGDRLFLDFLPKRPDRGASDTYVAHFLPLHSFWRVRQIEPTLQAEVLSIEWLGKLLKDSPDAIRHEMCPEPDHDTFFLTAQPKELQAFLLKHEKTPDAWKDDGLEPLTRRVGKPKE